MACWMAATKSPRFGPIRATPGRVRANVGRSRRNRESTRFRLLSPSPHQEWSTPGQLSLMPGPSSPRICGQVRAKLGPNRVMGWRHTDFDRGGRTTSANTLCVSWALFRGEFCPRCSKAIRRSILQCNGLCTIMQSSPQDINFHASTCRSCSSVGRLPHNSQTPPEFFQPRPKFSRIRYCGQNSGDTCRIGPTPANFWSTSAGRCVEVGEASLQGVMFESARSLCPEAEQSASTFKCNTSWASAVKPTLAKVYPRLVEVNPDLADPGPCYDTNMGLPSLPTTGPQSSDLEDKPPDSLRVCLRSDSIVDPHTDTPGRRRPTFRMVNMFAGA